jgi:glutathionylspermidine synthase
MGQNDLPEDSDQFNSIHTKLISAWSKIKPDNKCVHFTGVMSDDEDAGTLRYMAECAAAAGFQTEQVDISSIGINQWNQFLDQYNRHIDLLFRLYPSEYIAGD